MSSAVHEHLPSPGRQPMGGPSGIGSVPQTPTNDENRPPSTPPTANADQTGLKNQLRQLGSLLYDLMRGKKNGGPSDKGQKGGRQTDDMDDYTDRHEVQSWHGNYYQSNPVSKDPSMYSVCPENCDEWLFIDDEEEYHMPAIK